MPEITLEPFLPEQRTIKEEDMIRQVWDVRPPVVVFADQHIPFMDERVFDLQCQFIEWRKVKTIIISGDLADFYAISYFSKSPERIGAKPFADEMKSVRAFLRKLRDIAPNAQIILILGNHEFRLRKYIYAKQEEDAIETIINKIAYGATPQDLIPKLFDLPNLGIDIKDLKPDIAKFTDNFIVIGNGIHIGHFDRANKFAGYTAKNLVADKGVKLLQSHIHRVGLHMRTTLAGTIYGYEIGCSCSLDPVYTSQQDWQNGFAVIEASNDWSDSTVHVIPIIDYKFRYGNKLFTV
jgi:predicted MPP superfamily phosphohydrolase